VGDARDGVFDSGVGGLTVVWAILDQLAGEPLLSIGDPAHAPCGPRTIADIRRLALAAMDRLADEGMKPLVIACNPAPLPGVPDARERSGVPVVEVVEEVLVPAARRALGATRNRRVGIIGTTVTITSQAYEDAIAAASGVELTSVACPAFVAFVERGITTGRARPGFPDAYLAQLREADIDALILGCTHYPLLPGVISLVMGERVTLVSSAEETAEDVCRVLAREHAFRDPEPPPPAHRFLATGDQSSFARPGRRFLGPQMFTVQPAAAPARAGRPGAARVGAARLGAAAS
jgi:glutamate racemase